MENDRGSLAVLGNQAGPHPCCVHERMSSQTGGSSLPAPITRKIWGKLKRSRAWPRGLPRLNGAFSRAQGAPIAMSGAPAALVGRNDGHKTLYNDDTLDCWTGQSLQQPRSAGSSVRPQSQVRLGAAPGQSPVGDPRRDDVHVGIPQPVSRSDPARRDHGGHPVLDRAGCRAARPVPGSPQHHRVDDRPVRRRPVDHGLRHQELRGGAADQRARKICRAVDPGRRQGRAHHRLVHGLAQADGWYHARGHHRHRRRGRRPQAVERGRGRRLRPRRTRCRDRGQELSVGPRSQGRRRHRPDRRIAGARRRHDRRDQVVHRHALRFHHAHSLAQSARHAGRKRHLRPGQAGAGRGRSGRAPPVAREGDRQQRSADQGRVPRPQPQPLAVRDRRRRGADRRSHSGAGRRHGDRRPDALLEHQGPHQRVRHAACAGLVFGLHPQSHPRTGGTECRARLRAGHDHRHDGRLHERADAPADHHDARPRCPAARTDGCNVRRSPPCRRSAR